MQLSAKWFAVAGLCTLTACSSLSSLNPFSGKSDAKNAPAALSEFKQTMSVKTVWSANVGGAGNFVFTPAFVATDVYAAAADGTITKLSLNNGRSEWRINAGMRLTAGVGANADLVVVGGEKGHVLAFGTNGELRWKTQASTEILSAPVVAQGVVVVRSIDNKITAFDAVSGARKWVVERPLPALTLRTVPGMLVVGQQVIVALPGGRMTALSLNNGGMRWEAAVGEPKGATELERVADVSGNPAVAGQDVCASSYQGRVACFDVNSGAQRWVKNLSSEVGVGIDEMFLFASDVSGALNAYSRTGASAWRNDKLAHRHLSAPASFGRSVAVGDFEGYVHFLSREDGALIGRVKTDGSGILAAPLVAESNLIIQTKSGSVLALAAE